jgi:hypothetical protein
MRIQKRLCTERLLASPTKKRNLKVNINYRYKIWMAEWVQGYKERERERKREQAMEKSDKEIRIVTELEKKEREGDTVKERECV